MSRPSEAETETAEASRTRRRRTTEGPSEDSVDPIREQEDGNLLIVVSIQLIAHQAWLISDWGIRCLTDSWSFTQTQPEAYLLNESNGPKEDPKFKMTVRISDVYLNILLT